MSIELAKTLHIEASQILERLEDCSRIAHPTWIGFMDCIEDAVAKVETAIDELAHILKEQTA